MPACLVVQMYGMNECERIIFLSSLDRYALHCQPHDVISLICLQFLKSSYQLLLPSAIRSQNTGLQGRALEKHFCELDHETLNSGSGVSCTLTQEDLNQLFQVSFLCRNEYEDKENSSNCLPHNRRCLGDPVFM